MFEKERASVFNQVKRPIKRLIPYGSKTPLDVEGSFEATIKAGRNEANGTFYVINGGTRDLLGKDSAIELGVLRVGVDINQVETKEFAKFKDILVEIPIDETVKPVAQPYRRIPIPLEQKVKEKVQELLDCDIIEEVKQPSKWVSPIVPILKESGELRLCVDMRRANAAILRKTTHYQQWIIFSQRSVRPSFLQNSTSKTLFIKSSCTLIPGILRHLLHRKDCFNIND